MSPGLLSPGLLGCRGRRWRPDVPASHEQRGRAWEAGRSATTLLARRRPPSEPGEVHRDALPAECPVAQLCGMHRGAGWSFGHNCVPGTSVRGHHLVSSMQRSPTDLNTFQIDALWISSCSSCPSCFKYGATGSSHRSTESQVAESGSYLRQSA